MYIDENTGKVWRVVSVTPAGRREYGPLLTNYIENARPIIDEHHWWLNTSDQSDVAFCKGLARNEAGFYRCIEHPSRRRDFSRLSVPPFYPLACDPDTIYIRLDDNIVWMAPDAIRELVWFRLRHPHPFLVFSNTINSPLCSHLHERMVAVCPPAHVGYNFLDKVGHDDPEVAFCIHRAFMKAVEGGHTDRFKLNAWWLWAYEPNHLHCVSWFGHDMGLVVPVAIDDVKWLTQDTPARLGRPNAICGTSLVSHFLYGTQEAVGREDVLAGYFKLMEGSGIE